MVYMLIHQMAACFLYKQYVVIFNIYLFRLCVNIIYIL